MKQKLIILIISLSFVVIPCAISAQLNIPIIGADESVSQYTCITTPGVKTYGMKVIQANGTIKDVSVKAAKSQISKQIQGVTEKILNVSELLRSATSKKAKNKLKEKLASLRSQRETLKFIKTQILLCEKAELKFSASSVPVLLTNTVILPEFTRPVNLFMYGFKFTIPKNYKGKSYCVAVSNATSVPFGGINYPDPGEMTTEVYKNCQPFGAPVGNLCVNGLEQDEGMIILTQGGIQETEGDCTSTFRCSLNELKNYLPSFYQNTRLTSFKPGSCN